VRGRVAPSHGMAGLRFCGAGSVADTGGAAVSPLCRGAELEHRGGTAGGGRES
jgi:hypothetical protein